MKRILLFVGISTLFLTSCYKEYSPNSYDEWGYNSGEYYKDYGENTFVSVANQPISTFSIDADGGSYANVRRFLRNGSLPPVGAVRIEELINYFPFDYPDATGAQPFSLNGEIAACPWQSDHRLIRIGIKGKSLNPRPASNVVLLIDVSGSMQSSDKLDLLIYGFKKMVNQLSADDNVAIITYAGTAGIALPATPGDQKQKIINALEGLTAGGSTAGGAGIQKAYQIANDNFKEGGNNRIILGTDGDFNVGISSEAELDSLIKTKRDQGIFLTVCAVGTGNLQEATMEQLADHGNGTYEYIDSKMQAQKVFVDEFSKFFTVAKDVKVQVTFNSNMVKRYRLIGYENRSLDSSDFSNDKKDAGELGADQTVTALYEIEPASQVLDKQANVFVIDFRYKNPDQDVSQLVTLPVQDEGHTFVQSSENFRFAASVAAFGMLLRNSSYAGDATYTKTKQWAVNASQYDPHSYRSEFISLIDKASALK